MSSSIEAEAQAKAESNARVIDALLQQLPPAASGRDILFINDVTLYLQAGCADSLLAHIAQLHMRTLIVNGYWGQRLGDSDLFRQFFSELSRRLFDGVSGADSMAATAIQWVTSSPTNSAKFPAMTGVSRPL